MTNFNKREIKKIQNILKKLDSLKSSIIEMSSELNSLIGQKQSLNNTDNQDICPKEEILRLYRSGVKKEELANKFNMTRTEIDLIIKLSRN